MTNLQKLEAKIKELVPEIMELKPGCKIRWCQIVGIVAGFDICKGKWQFYNESNNIVPFDEKPEDGEILGRPITLEDVLMALNKKTPRKVYFLRMDGVLFEWEKFTDGGDGHHGVKSTYIETILGKPLSEQSEEAITNLLKIFEV